MKSSLFLSLLTTPLALCSFEVDPWFGDVFEFQLDASYTYSYFNRFQHAINPHTHSKQQLACADLGVAFTPNWDNQLEFEVAQTRHFTPNSSWHLRSYGWQSRYLFLDDIAGDPVSVTGGIMLRGVPSRNLRDINSPYHGQFNAELNGAIGKEWSQTETWQMRTFFFGAVGMANRGYPWLRGEASFEGSFLRNHQYQLFTRGEFGFGPRQRVNTEHFTGYGKIHHQSIDVGAAYRYAFDLWGTLSVEYARRVFARSYPEHVNFFTVRYSLPFSMF